MDYSLLTFINSFAGKWLWLDMIGIIFSDFLIYALPLIIFGVYFFSKKRKKIGIMAVKIISAVILVALVEYITNQVVARPRPFITHNEIYQLTKFFVPPTDYSFPSGHTSLAFVMVFSVLVDWKKFGLILLIPAFLVGLSRIFVGVHYPIDIVGGIVTAILAVFVIEFLTKRFNILHQK
ncbi:phosphatase PAP2 family protein [Patescibacteria group bacterium AH-259-L05]|nr:phosphatase PAP2 family protein [Patescibacteria group bacterium AH-259-L05]